MKIGALIFAIATSILSAQEPVQVSIGALNVSPGSKGLVYIRTGEKESQPLQLRTSYFSGEVKLGAPQLELFAEPFKKNPQPADKPPVPLLRMPLAPSGGPWRILIWPSKSNPTGYEGKAFPVADWPNGCIVLMNAGDTPLGFASGPARKLLRPGEAFVFTGRNSMKGEPVKLYKNDPSQPGEPLVVYSTVWSVPKSGREIVVISPGEADYTVSTQTLIEEIADGKLGQEAH